MSEDRVRNGSRQSSDAQGRRNLELRRVLRDLRLAEAGGRLRQRAIADAQSSPRVSLLYLPNPAPRRPGRGLSVVLSVRIDSHPGPSSLRVDVRGSSIGSAFCPPAPVSPLSPDAALTAREAIGSLLAVAFDTTQPTRQPSSAELEDRLRQTVRALRRALRLSREQGTHPETRGVSCGKSTPPTSRNTRPMRRAS